MTNEAKNALEEFYRIKTKKPGTEVQDAIELVRWISKHENLIVDALITRHNPQ